MFIRARILMVILSGFLVTACTLPGHRQIVNGLGRKHCN